jgi:hypothetical protein
MLAGALSLNYYAKKWMVKSQSIRLSFGEFQRSKENANAENVSERIQSCLGCIKFGYMFVIEISDLLRHNILEVGRN